MPYQRKLVAKSRDLPELEMLFGHLGQVRTNSDPGWLEDKLKSLHSAGVLALSQMERVIGNVKARDWSDYKVDVARRKQKESLYSARKALLGFLKKEIDEARLELQRTKALILRITEPEVETGSKAILNELRAQEIRQLIRNADPKHRPDLVRHNPDFLKALVGAPDALLAESLEKLRYEYAFSIDPSLELMLRDEEATYKLIRKRAGEINATSIALLTKEKLPDPIELQEHFAVFPPDTPMEQEYANKAILAEEREKVKQENKLEFEKQDRGIAIGE
jgi:hypothetical protein